MNRKTRERETRKNEVVKIAGDLFFSQGYEQTTMDEIAEKSEFSKTTLYAYFQNKEELYFEVYLKTWAARNQHTFGALTPSMSGLEQLEIFANKYFSCYLGNKAYIDFQFYGMHNLFDISKLNNDIKERFDYLKDESYDKIAAMFARGNVDGTLRDELDSEVAFDYFVVSLRSIMLRVVMGSDVNEDHFKKLLAILLSGLRSANA